MKRLSTIRTALAAALLALVVGAAPYVTRLALPAAAVIALAPLPAAAQEDAITLTYIDGGTGPGILSTAGLSNQALYPRGTTIALQSETGAYHYRLCPTSTCVALQTDPYVPQFWMFDVPTTSDRQWVAIAADGTSTETTYVYQVNLP